jgi:eukaryotic-like serine/threonine-protein kinase
VAERFRIDRLIGSGGMASVYEATDVALGRSVALKLFRVDAADPAETERQKGEVAVLARLNHFALVTLYDAGTSVIDGEPRTYIVMEFIDGPDLRSRISVGRLPSSEVAELGADLSEALHYVHSRGIIHRDIKPANVLLAPSDFPGRTSHAKLADFGIARLLDDTRLTATGALLGTASYLSPEQALGETIGGPSDVYSLGLVLLECLTGERAFPGTAIESAMARLQRQPEIPASLGPEWNSVLDEMLRRDPAERLAPGDAAVHLRELVGVEVDLPAETRLFTASSAATTQLSSGTTQLSSGTTQLSEPTDAGSVSAAATALVGPVGAASASSGAADTAITQRFVPAQARSTDTDTAPGADVDVDPGADPTLVMKPVARSQAPRTQPRRALSRRVIMWLVVAVLLIIAAVVLVFNLQSRPPAATPPSYPAVDGELGTHLQDLQESVTP